MRLEISLLGARIMPDIEGGASHTPNEDAERGVKGEEVGMERKEFLMILRQ
jgi:hypothetical protein